MNAVSLETAGSDLKEAIRKTVDSLGGFSRFIKKGETVLLKPNFNTADPPPASSDPYFIEAVSDLLYEAGAKLVMVGDSSMLRLNTCKVFDQVDLYRLEGKKSCPTRVYSFDEKEWVTRKIPGAKYLKKVTIPKMLDEVDRLILLPNLKTHFLAQMTGALKLSVGFIKPIERISLHMGNLQEKIAELNTIIHPDLIIMDARKCFIKGGPAKGEIAQPNKILASTSRVEIDSSGVGIIKGFTGNSLASVNPEEIVQIKMARELGIS